eukprot:scaffold647823_cov46-Prasinocladus_malaysianus.AAC.2
MCSEVHLYGYAGSLDEAAGTGQGLGLSYYSASPVGMSVFDIWTGRTDKQEQDSRPIDNAIVELLELTGFLHIHR